MIHEFGAHSRSRLGPYEVAAQIGVGGTGEVYCARDTNLKRQVAIKVLPASVAADPPDQGSWVPQVVMAVPIAAGATFSAGAPAVLFPTRIVGSGLDGGTGRQYDVAPDGRFLINTELPGDAAPITLIQNWTPGPTK